MLSPRLTPERRAILVEPPGNAVASWPWRAPDRVVAAIVAAFLLANLTLVAWKGVRIGGDTPKYTSAAARLLDGGSVEPHLVAHLAYLIPIAVCQSIGVGPIGLILLQLALAGVAIVTVYRMAMALAGPVAALLAAALFACDVEVARWHAFVLTDSLYLSTLTITVWCVHRFVANPARHWDRALAAGLPLLVVLLLRPEGWPVAPLAVMYWLVGALACSIRRVTVLALALLCALLMLAFVPRVRGTLDSILPVEPLRSGQTIWGSGQWRISMPSEPDGGEGIASAVRYAAVHPVQASALMLARVGVHFAAMRPAYSFAHNVVILVWFAPIYALAVYGWRVVGKDPLAGWSLAVIAAHTGVVAVTLADPDGRNLAHVMPLIYVFSACGAGALVERRGPAVGTVAGCPGAAQPKSV